MTKLLVKGCVALSMVLGGMAPAAPAFAHDRSGNYEGRGSYGDRSSRDDGYDRYRDTDRAYGRDGRRHHHHRAARDRCGSDKGTTGLILGGVLGGLLGRAVAGDHGDRTAGLIIGGGAGALAGRAIDRSDDRCRR